MVEVEFGRDTIDPKTAANYQTIAGSAPFETWTPDTCGCGDDGEKERVRVPVEEVIVVGIALLLLLLILDDAAGGAADDAAIPPLVEELGRRLGPMLKPGLLPP